MHGQPRFIIGLLLSLTTYFQLSTGRAQAPDPYYYLVLRATDFVQFDSHYVDTYDDDKGSYVLTDPGPNGRLFLKYRSSSPAASFFQAGGTYTWRAPGTRSPQGTLQGHYGHYVVEGWAAPENVPTQFAGTCWRDLTRTQVGTQDGLTYLRGGQFIAGAVPWDFRWESNPPDRPAQWRWDPPAAPGNLMDLPLRSLTAPDIRGAISEKTIQSMTKSDRAAVDVPTFLSQYGATIDQAAQKFSLHPEVVAAVLIAEQRDQKSEIPVYLGGWYLGTYSAATAKRLGGYFGWMLDMDASIGLGQVRPRTVQKYNLGDAGRLSRPVIAQKLTDPEFNIFASAQYIRIIADAGARYGKNDYAKIFNNPLDNTFLSGLSLADFSKHSLDWKPGHLILLGSEYTSAMWDGKYKPWWGLGVLRSYQDALAWNTCP